MKIKIISMLILVALASAIGATNTSAQSVASILEKLERIEKQLNTIENNRKSSLSQMKQELAALKLESKSPEFKESVAILIQLIEALAAKIEVMSKAKVRQIAQKVVPDPVEAEKEVVPLATAPAVEPRPPESTALTISAIEISGFSDFVKPISSGDQGNSMHVGQAEFDFATNLDEKIGIEAAVAFDGETFGLGALIMDFHLLGSSGDHFRVVDGIDHSGLIVGQFDVPFGIDWHVYPSIDRKLVSGPMVVEGSHDSWNDFGVQGYLEHRYFNAVLFATNGFGYETEDSIGSAVEVETNVAVGSRFGVKPHEWFEIGASFASLFNEESDSDINVVGMDLQFNYDRISVKGEYITRKAGITRATPVTSYGFYGQAMYDFGRVYLATRFGTFTPDKNVGEDQKRLSVGTGWVILDGCEARYEYQTDTEGKEDASLIQLIVGF